MIRTPAKTGGGGPTGPVSLPASLQAALPEAFAKSGAAKWNLTPGCFAAALARSVEKHFGTQAPAAKELNAYISNLHLEDVALASACAEGLTPAWDHFVGIYQPYLRNAAAAVLRCPATAAAACELADSLFGDLYGVSVGSRSRSLFRYFHGRSSLKTWLRALLAQRHIDFIRSTRRLVSIDDDSTVAKAAESAAPTTSAGPDPYRRSYLELFRQKLEVALGLLDPRDKDRLRLYYAEQQTLAAIGRQLGEHESSVSRNLERTRRELREQMEQALRSGTTTSNGAAQSGLSDAQIALCFEYAAEDAPIDLARLFPADPAAVPAPQLKPSLKSKGREP